MRDIDLFLESEKSREELVDPIFKGVEDTFDDILDAPGPEDIDANSDIKEFQEQETLRETQHAAHLLEAIKEAKKLNPDKEARIKKLSDQTGYPEEIIKENPEGLQATIESEQTSEILNKSPKLKAMAADLSRFAHDDFDNLSTFERIHRDYSVGLDRGMMSRELGLLNRKLMGEIGRDDLIQEEKQEIRDRITEIKKEIPDLHGSGGVVEAAANALGSFIEGVPQVLAAGAIGGGSAAAGGAIFGPHATVARALAGAGYSMVAEVFRQSSGVEGGILRDSLITEGVDEDIANRVGEVGGNLAGLLETLGQTKFMAGPFKDALKKRLLGDVKKKVLQDAAEKRGLAAGIGTFSKTLGKTVAGETATELGQELIQVTGEETGKAIDAGEHESITMEAFGDRMVDVLKETLKAMVVLGTPGASLSVLSANSKANQADKNEAFMKEMGDSVQASKLIARDESTYGEFVDGVADGSEMQNVYIDAEKLQEVYQEDTATLLEEIGASDQFDVALETKGDIIIPLSVYATKIARDVDAHSKISRHTKFDPNGNTSFQVEEMRKDNILADNIIKKQELEQPFLESGSRVFQSVQQQLVETGRFTPDQANQYGVLYQAFAETQAKIETVETGETVFPEDMYKRRGLIIRDGSVASEGTQTLDQTNEADLLVIKAREGDKEAQAKLKEYGLEWEFEPIVRFVAKGEVDTLLRGERFEGTKEAEWSAEGREGVVDVTKDIEGKDVPASNKDYRIRLNDSFDDKASKSKIRMKSKQDGWILEGGYDLNDVATIEERQPDGSWKVVHQGEQQAQTLDQAISEVTRSPEFQAFFKDSKIVDNNGEPLVIYHGTSDSIQKFDLDHPNRKDTGWLGTGVYMTDSSPLAGAYALLKSLGPKSGNAGANVIPMFVSLKNPYFATIEDKRKLQGIALKDPIRGREAADQFTEKLKGLGHDGVVLQYDAKDVGASNISREIVAFEPNQVKSIFNERPTDSPNILNQVAEDVFGKKDGLYSEVRRVLEEMQLPVWKGKKNIFTPAMDKELVKLKDEMNTMLNKGHKGPIWENTEQGRRASELVKLRMDQDDQLISAQANGKDIWAKLKTTPGIKVEELKWMGIEEWLTGNPKAKFTREQAVTFAKNNGINVETVVADQESSSGEIEWEDSRVYDDPEAWQGEVEDAEHNGLKEEAVETIRAKHGHNIPKDLEEDVESQLDLDEARSEWIMENFASEVEEQVEFIARERYLDNPYYIVESVEGIDLSIFGNDDVGWSIREGGWQYHENNVGPQEIYSLNEAKIEANQYAFENDIIRDEDMGDEQVHHWESLVMGGGHKNYREIKLTLPNLDDHMMYSGSQYESPEAHQFPDENIVAFLRVDDRELRLGEKVKVKDDEFDATGYEVLEDDFPGLSGAYVGGELLKIVYDPNGERVDSGFGTKEEVMQKFVQKKNDELSRSNLSDDEANTYMIDEMQSDLHQEGRQKGYSTGKSAEEITSDVKKRVDAADKVTLPLLRLFNENTNAPTPTTLPETGKELQIPIMVKTLSEVDGRWSVPRLLSEEEKQLYSANPSGWELDFRGIDQGVKNLSISGAQFFDMGFNLLREDFKNEELSLNAHLGPARKDISLLTYEEARSLEYQAVANLIKEKFDEAEIDKLQDYVAEGDTFEKKVKAEKYGVPDAPFKGDAWMSLALKRAIVDAVQGGYEAIAWPDSEVLVDRYSRGSSTKDYRKLYQIQYDKKMPSIVKKLTGEKAAHVLTLTGRNNALPDMGYHIIPITDKLKEKVSKEGFSLFQEKKGSFQFGDDMTQDDSIINLFKKADLSTFLHESGHFFFESMRDMASKPGASKRRKDDMKSLLNFISGDKPISMDTWNGMSLEERRSGHEKVARAFEAYLFEGKAPTVDLSNMFRRFRSWLKEIYKSLARLNVTLTDDVRAVFDRMLATDEEILATKQANEMVPLFTSQETAGMNAAQWTDYQKTVGEDQERADELLEGKVLKDMKWLSGARGKVLRQLQREQRERRAGVQQEAAVTVGESLVYKAKQFLRTPIEKKPKKKSYNDVVDPTEDSLFTAIAKLGGLDKDEVIKYWGVDGKDKFPSGLGGGFPVLRAGNPKDPKSKKGLSIGRIGDALAELGYLPVDESGKYDDVDFESRFFDEHSGNKRVSTSNDSYDISEEYENFTATEEGYIPLNLEELKGAKLSAPLLRELYAGRDPIWEGLPSKGRYAMVSEDGMDPELIAKTIGYGSADQMITELINAPDMREAVKQETDRRMLELYGDMNSQEAKERAINKAIHGPLRERVLHTELSTLAKRVGSGNMLAKAAKERAKDAIAKMNIKDIRPNNYVMAERRANANAEKALMNGNLGEATNHKRAAVLNYHFAREAMNAVEEVDVAVRYFNKFDSKETRKNIDLEYLDQIDSALEIYDLRKSVTQKERKRRKGLQEWINSEIGKGNNPIISDELMKNMGLQHYRDIPLEELRGLRDSVKNIEHLGRMKDRLLAQVEKIKLDDAAKAIEDRMTSVNEKSGRTRRRNKNKFLNKGEHPQDKIGKTAIGYYAEHRKIANLGREADGYEDNGPFWKYITRPMNERADWEAVQLAEAAEGLAELFDVYSASELTNNLGALTGGLAPAQRLYKRVYIPDLNVSMSKMERIMVALNWGNADNRNRVLDGFGWENEHVELVLDGLDARDWQFVENVWGFIHQYWPQIEAKEKRVSGVAPEKVIGLPVTTKFGTFNAKAEAGYFPITFSREDKKSHDQILADQTKRAMQGDMSRATTARNHTKARMESAGKKKIRTDFGVIFEHVNAVIHDLAWHEFLIDNNRLMSHDKVVSSIEAHMGIDKFNAMTNTVKDIAAGEVQNVKQFEKIFNHLRAGVSISAMGWNLGTALLQPFGLTQSMARIGPKWVWKAMLRHWGNPSKMNETVDSVREQSSFMRLRAKTMNREINEIRNKITRSSFFQKQFGSMGESYFTLIAKAQQIADVPTWLAAQEKALASGVDPDTAVALADQAVIDAQGSGHIKDLAQVQRGGPLLKLWTNFMSYFQVTFNLTMDSLGKTRWNDPASIGNLAVDIFMLYTAPIILSFMLREAVIKGKCEHGTDLVCVAKEMGVEHVSYLFGGAFGFREAISGFQGFYGYQGPAGARFFADFGDFTKQALQGDIDKALIKSGFKAVGVATHFPTGQVIKTIEGIIALESGETSLPTAPLFGYSKR